MSKTGPRGAAALFLATLSGELSSFDVGRLARLIEEFAVVGYRVGLEEAKGIYRELHPGGCKMLSQGEGCWCFLCRIDNKKAGAQGA